jgi:hypothetical protein
LLLKSDRVEKALAWSRDKQRAEFLYAFIEPNGVGVEVGVQKAYFTRFLLQKLQPRKIFLIDLWYSSGGIWQWSGGNQSPSYALGKILINYSKYIDNEKVVPMVGDDLEILGCLENHSLDWAYIDSSHEYSHTLREIDLLVDKVKIGGVIAGDDWRVDESHKHHGVRRAVQERVSDGSLIDLQVDESSLQWLTRSAHRQSSRHQQQ